MPAPGDVFGQALASADLDGMVHSAEQRLINHVAMEVESRKALTYDAGKEPLAWLPWDAIDAMSRVQMYGHGKYKDFNNYRKGMEVSRNLSCALRHIRDYLQGENEDHESGESPLAHAMCRIAFVLQNIAEGKAIDDRFRQE